MYDLCMYYIECLALGGYFSGSDIPFVIEELHESQWILLVWSGQPAPPGHVPPPPEINKGLSFGLIKGNQWVFISPDHKAGYFWGGVC